MSQPHPQPLRINNIMAFGPPIDSHTIVEAWLDAHFVLPNNRNPLIRGLIVPPQPLLSSFSSDNCAADRRRSKSPSAPSWESAGNSSSHRGHRPQKRLRLTSNTVHPPCAAHSGLADRKPIFKDLASEGIFEIPYGGHGGGDISGGGGVPEPETEPEILESGIQDDAVRGAGSNATSEINTLTLRTFSASLGDTKTASGLAEGSSVAASLSATDAAMSPPKRRKTNSSSPSNTGSDTSDICRKRQHLALLEPSAMFGTLGPADARNDLRLVPKGVITILKMFSVGTFETACFPATAETDQLVATSFPLESIPSHARLIVTDSEDSIRALDIVKFAIGIHIACATNSRRCLDESSWYQPVRNLLSVEPPAPGSTSVVPTPPALNGSPYSNPEDLFLTLDATTKSTDPGLAPRSTNIKLDAILAFNPDHRTCVATYHHATRAGIKLNAFSDSSLDGTIVILGAEVKSPGGSGGGAEAEYQVGVWGMKTINLTKDLAQGDSYPRCEYALSVSVYGHVWSLHVTYWRGEALVTHGPLYIGSTDSLYGTMKIVAFVKTLKMWARDELWQEWEAMVGAVPLE